MSDADAKNSREARFKGLEIQNLVDGARNGDDLSWQVLVEKYKDRVYWTCFRYLRHAQESEDALQETFVKAIRKLPNSDVQTIEHFEGWLITIAYNTAIEIYRKRRRERERFTSLEVVDIDHARSFSADSSRALQAEEILNIVWDCIERLPAAQKNAAQSRYLFEFSYGEIAELLGKTFDQIRGLLQRARVDLETCLEISGLKQSKGG